jgi:hypothetical protein
VIKSNPRGAGHTLQKEKTTYVNRNWSAKFHWKKPSGRHRNIWEHILKLILDTKVKVKLSLDLTNQAPRHEDIRGTGGTAPLLLTSVLDEGELSASHSCQFTHLGNSPEYAVWRGLSGLQSWSEHYGEKKNFSVTRNRDLIPWLTSQ